MLWSAASGFSALSVDVEALKNGTVNLLHASGIMPDGTLFNMPGSDPAPEPRSFSGLFPPDRYTLTVSLAISARQPNGLNCALEEEGSNSDVRFVAQTVPVADETIGGDDKPVRLGRKNFRLVLDSEIEPKAVSIPVIRILRSGSGELVPDPDFIPPCLRIGASARLMYLLRRLLEMMEEKAATLVRSSTAPDSVQFASREIAAFWFLQVVHASLGPLRHHYASKSCHPEQLFVEMLRMAGGLCTFALEAHPRMLPVYDHTQPDICFASLDHLIREYLELVIPTSSLRIDLAPTADCFYAGAITDERAVGRASWLLGVRAPMRQLDLITKAPQLVKICSEKFVSELVRRQMRGLSLNHVPVPPPAIAPRPEMQYFSIDRTGPFWEHIVQTRRVGVYIPEEIKTPELELLVVLE